MARRKSGYIFRPPVRPRADQSPVPAEPVVEPTRQDVRTDLVRMGRLPRPPREHKRASFRFRDSFKNYACALLAIMDRTHPGLQFIAKYRVAYYCWRLLSDYEREAWAAPAEPRF